ncbi:MAG: hypothetical protein FJX77_14235 [Armatimonadetes bacterium]|nr:hypothetical protein [Armatimonadota bacterium]
MPVRIDLAGGWTDTPPQACAAGGTVLNAALLLNGQMPLLVRGRVLADPVLRFVARDLGKVWECHTLESLRDYHDPADPFALHKAALAETGLDRPAARTLPHLLELLGGGLELETSSEVPKGSGLGTSSILGAAVLAVLRTLTGQPANWSVLFGAVLRLEQRMTTGGGWQDQVGGMLPGFKITRTRPGWEPIPEVESLTPPSGFREEFHQRMIMFYTGVPRLAKNVLQRVVTRYVDREPEVLAALHRLPLLAEQAAAAIRAGDLDALGAAVQSTWDLNPVLELSATNPQIEKILRGVAPYCTGRKLAGAGGGGFALFLARSGEDADRARAWLAEQCPQGRAFDAAVSEQGLTVRVGDAQVLDPAEGGLHTRAGSGK